MQGFLCPSSLIDLPLLCGSSHTKPAQPVLHTLGLCFPFPRISAASFPPACLPCPHPCPHRGRQRQLAGDREGGVWFPSSSSRFLAPECCQENGELPLSVIFSRDKADFHSIPSPPGRPILLAWLPRNLPPDDSTLRMPSQIAQTLGLSCTHFLSFPNHGLI